MKNIYKSLGIIAIMAIICLSFICCGGSTGDGIPSINEHGISELSGTEYDLGGAVFKGTEEEALMLYTEAMQSLIGPTSYFGVTYDYSYAGSDVLRKVEKNTIDLGSKENRDMLIPFGVSNLNGYISFEYSDDPYWVISSSDISYDYDSNNDNSSLIPGKPDNWVKGKLKAKGNSKITEIKGGYSTELNGAYSYAIAYKKSNTEGAKFILTCGISYSDEKAERSFYGTLKVYNNNGVEIYSFDINSDDIEGFTIKI